MYYNNTQALMLLGHILNDLNILNDKKYNINDNTFNTKMHKLIFRVCNNIGATNDVKNIDGVTISNYLAKYEDQYKYFTENSGEDIITKIKEDAEKNSLKLAYETCKKFEILRDMRGTFNITEIYNPNIKDSLEREAKYKEFEKLSIDDVLNYFKSKLNGIATNHQNNDGEYKRFKAGKNIRNLVKQCKEDPVWGKAYQSQFLNRITRGMLPKKYMISSAGTGGGKSRQMIADAVLLTVENIFDADTGDWITNLNGGESVLYISTELEEDEIQLCMLATVSGVPEEKIKDGEWTREEESRIIDAADEIEKANLHVVYATDLNMASIRNDVEHHIINYGIGYLFFDYIQLFPSLSREIIESYGYVPREDEMLKIFSSFLKVSICNGYNLFLRTATQLNRSYKDKGNTPDATHIRGGMATADKCDILMITVECEEKDLDKVQPILDVGFSNHTPTHMNYICKNRGGSWKGVIIWTNMNLDINKIKDCFVTDINFKLIDKIQPIDLLSKKEKMTPVDLDEDLIDEFGTEVPF